MFSLNELLAFRGAVLERIAMVPRLQVGLQ